MSLCNSLSQEGSDLEMHMCLNEPSVQDTLRGKAEIRLLKAWVSMVRMFLPFLQVEGIRQGSLGYPGYREGKGRDSAPFLFLPDVLGPLSRPCRKTQLTRTLH